MLADDIGHFCGGKMSTSTAASQAIFPRAPVSMTSPAKDSQRMPEK